MGNGWAERIRPADHGETPSSRKAGLMKSVERRADVTRERQVGSGRGGELRRGLGGLSALGRTLIVLGQRSWPGSSLLRHVDGPPVRGAVRLPSLMIRVTQKYG